MQNKYFAQLAALSILWGATFLFTRVATPEIGPSLTAAGRIGLGAATLARMARMAMESINSIRVNPRFMISVRLA